MKSKLFTILFIFFALGKLVAQDRFGNEWIAYDQNYLKFSINKKGIYSINYNTIKQTTNNFENVGLNSLQLFYRGKEIAIAIKNDKDQIFNEGDSIEFFGIENDGSSDSLLYRPYSAKPHPYSSIYDDNSTYFLTISKQNNGKRIKENKGIERPKLKQSYYIENILKVWSEQSSYSSKSGYFPLLMQSYFEPGEGMTSNLFDCNKHTKDEVKIDNDFFEEKLTLPTQILKNNMPIKLELFATGRYQNSSRILKLAINDKIVASQENYEYEKAKFNVTISPETISDVNKLKFNVYGQSTRAAITFDAFCVSYYKLSYPGSFSFIDNHEYELIANIVENSYISLNTKSPITVWDITNNLNPISLNIINSNSDSTNVIIEKSDNNRKIWVSSKAIEIKNVENVKFEKFDPLKYDFFLLSNKKLKQSVNSYQEYRESNLGGNHKVKTTYIDDIFNEFNFGERSPVAVRKFADFIISKNANEKHLFIIGRANSLTETIKTTIEDDFVPSIGYPASDLLLTSGLNGNDIDVPGIPTGRIAAINNEQVFGYLEKVKEFENSNIKPIWKKNFLLLGGGKSTYEISDFKGLLNRLGNYAVENKVGGEFKMYNKTNPLTEVEQIDISGNINNGVGVLTFCGHSTYQITDLNFGYVSDEKSNFKNQGLYPFMFFNGCGAGNIFGTNYNTLSTDWILTPKKGAINILGHSFLSYFYSNSVYMEKLYQLWFSNKNMMRSSIGKVVQTVAQELVKTNRTDPYILANIHQMVLQGDPAVRIFNFDKPDLETNDDALFLTGDKNGKTISNSDSLRLGIGISNLGIYEKGTKISYTIKKNYIDNTSKSQNYILDAVANQDTAVITLKRETSLKSIEVTMDGDKKIEEMDESNNVGSITLNWSQIDNLKFYSTGAVPDKISPLLNITLDGRIPSDSMKVAVNPLLKILLEDNNSFGAKTDKLIVNYREICDKCPNSVTKLELPNITGDPNQIIANVLLSSFKPGTYEMLIQGFDAKKNASGQVYVFTFTIKEKVETKIKVYPNPLSLFTSFDVPIYDNDGKQPVTYTLSILNSTGYSIFQKNGTLQDRINTIVWDAKNSEGNQQQPGIYFYKLNLFKNGENETFDGKLIIRQ